MKRKKLIPLKFRHVFPYTFTQLLTPIGNGLNQDLIKMRKGRLSNIQNEESRMITFYKNISRL